MPQRRKSLLSINPEKLSEAIRRAGKKPHKLNIEQVLIIAEEFGVIPDNFRENAYRLAVYDQLRRALRNKNNSRQIPLYANFKEIETKPDGTTRLVQQYKHVDHLTEDEWDHVIEDRKSGILGDMMICNRLVQHRNNLAAERGWQQLALPFPEVGL